MNNLKIKYMNAVEEGTHIGDFQTFKWIPYVFPSNEYDILVRAMEDVEMTTYNDLPCFHSNILEAELGIKYFNIASWDFYD